MAEQGVPTLELGASLRDARIGRRLDVRGVADATMIPARVIEAFEAERLEQLPERVYARSFLREYAAFLDLDPDVYAAAYDARVAPAEPEAPPVRPRRREARRGVAVVAALAAAAAAGIVTWQLLASGKPQPAAAPPTTQPQPSTPPTTTKPPPATSDDLTLTATRGACWLRVQSGTRVVFERTLEQGRTVRFGLGQPLSIRLGAPWNVEAWIGRRSVTAALPQRIGNVVVGVDGVRAAT
jgi:helix-turn-helix protein/uncharacterized protein DUF4115